MRYWLNEATDEPFTIITNLEISTINPIIPAFASELFLLDEEDIQNFFDYILRQHRIEYDDKPCLYADSLMAYSRCTPEQRPSNPPPGYWDEHFNKKAWFSFETNSYDVIDEELVDKRWLQYFRILDNLTHDDVLSGWASAIKGRRCEMARLTIQGLEKRIETLEERKKYLELRLFSEGMRR